ncbi:MAG: Ig-like domain-containing protein [Pseudomonadota bacterium]
MPKRIMTFGLISLLFAFGCGNSGRTGAPFLVDSQSVTVDPTSGIPADGIMKAAIFVTLAKAGAPLVGVNVHFLASGNGNILSADIATDADGKALGSLASTEAEEKTISVEVTSGGQTLTLAEKPTAVFLPTTTEVLAPSSLDCTAGYQEIICTWPAAAKATSYKVYVGTTSGSYNFTGSPFEVTTPSATIDGLTNGTTYYVLVKSVSADGESATSSPERWASPGEYTTLVQISPKFDAYIVEPYCTEYDPRPEFDDQCITWAPAAVIDDTRFRVGNWTWDSTPILTGYAKSYLTFNFADSAVERSKILEATLVLTRTGIGGSGIFDGNPDISLHNIPDFGTLDYAGDWNLDLGVPACSRSSGDLTLHELDIPVGSLRDGDNFFILNGGGSIRYYYFASSTYSDAGKRPVLKLKVKNY